MPVRTDLFIAIGFGILLSVCIGCERRQEGQVERGAEQPAERAAEQADAAPLSVETSAEARIALVAWFECEECTDHELDRVVKYGDFVVPNLSATLQGGLSPSKREELRQHHWETYRELVEYAKKHKGSSLQMSEQEYLATYFESAESLYRSRAATALVRIGTPSARAALARSLELRELPSDVRRTVENALVER